MKVGDRVKIIENDYIFLIGKVGEIKMILHAGCYIEKIGDTNVLAYVSFENFKTRLQKY